ncbi:hypothetical protein OC834_000891 [Tilletia horrida]|nr:hypothetical protein OC834_000891 [Tilletia horrida]
MAAGADAGSFNTLWFLLLIPLILFAIGLVVAVWMFIAKRRSARRRQSMLRNVPVIQAEAEAEIEKMERRASVRSKRSLSIAARGRNSLPPSDAATAHASRGGPDPVMLERDLTRSLSTRSQREVYARTLKARQQQQRQSAHQPHPIPVHFSASQQAHSDQGHGISQDHLSAPSQSSHRPRTPEMEEGRAGFADSGPLSDVEHLAPSSDDSHTSSRRFHQYRRQDANELSVIGEAETDISETGLTPSASSPSGPIVLSPSAVLATAVLAAEPESYGASRSPVDPNVSPFRDPEPESARPGREASAESTDASNTTFSSRRTTADDSIAEHPSETSESADGQTTSFGAKIASAVGLLAAPVVSALRSSPDEKEEEGEEKSTTRSSKDKTSPGLTPTLTPRPGGVAGQEGGSPSEETPSNKTPTMARTPSPAALEREAQDHVAPVPEFDSINNGGTRGAPGGGSGATSSGLGLGTGSGAAAAGGGAGKFLAPLLPQFLRPSHDEGSRSRASLAKSDAVSESVRVHSPSPTSPTAASGPALGGMPAGQGPSTSTPTKTRASMTSLRSALNASTPAPPPMMPSRSATGGSTGGNSGAPAYGSAVLLPGAGGASAAGAGAGAAAGMGGGSWTYTSRASEWKSASSSSVARGGGGGGGGAYTDPRASSTSLASRASSREGHRDAAGTPGGRPGMPRRTSHGVAGSMYREHFGEEGGEDDESATASAVAGGGGATADDHSSRISHMLDEDEERERERAALASPTLGTGDASASAAALERKGSTMSKKSAPSGGGGGGARGMAAALMRKTSSKSGRSLRTRALSPPPAENRAA